MQNLIWNVLNEIKGLGNKTLISIYREFPELNFENFNDYLIFLNSKVKKKNIMEILENENEMQNRRIKAAETISKHREHGIHVISIDSEYYPTLLKYIDDPPIVLYAKGNINLLKDDARVAFIGTREPTELGYLAAKKIARLFANNEYTIVSGLALGIDTAGHEGALEAYNGKTIAVMAGGLDNIYPAKNKKLAERIIQSGGLLVSEYALFEKPFKSAFIQRDRLQSGLSLAVCPVQTPITGGTQHTIKYSKLQNRLLFCPYPQEPESCTPTQGIYELIKNNQALAIRDHKDYAEVVNLIKGKAKEFNVTVPDEFIVINNTKIPNIIEDELIKIIEMCKKENVTLENIIDVVKRQFNQ